MMSAAELRGQLAGWQSRLTGQLDGLYDAAMAVTGADQRVILAQAEVIERVDMDLRRLRRAAAGLGPA